MALRVAVAAVLLLGAVAVALVVERRRKDPPIRDTGAVPSQLDRDDFPDPAIPWLVVLFSSRSCDSCETMRDIVGRIGSGSVATCDVEFPVGADLHDRYGIPGVPLVLVADADGVVRASFAGPVTEEEIRRSIP